MSRTCSWRPKADGCMSGHRSCCGERTCRWRKSPATPARFPTSCFAESASGCRWSCASAGRRHARKNPAFCAPPELADGLNSAQIAAGDLRQSIEKEPHLHARQLNDIVVAQALGLAADGRAVDEREVVALAAVDVDYEVAL